MKTKKQKEKEWIDLPNLEKLKYNGFKGYCLNEKRMVF